MNWTTFKTTIERLSVLRSQSDFVTYSQDNRAGRSRVLLFSVHGLCSSGEILVEMTDRRSTRVQSFISRHKNCPPEARREELTLVDAADAFALARQMARYWPRTARSV